VTKNDWPILETNLPRNIDVGISIRTTDPGMVPLYECLEACKFGGYTWNQWFDVIDYNDRVLAVAHYRMHNLIESHIQAVAAAKNGVKNRSGANRR